MDLPRTDIATALVVAGMELKGRIAGKSGTAGNTNAGHTRHTVAGNSAGACSSQAEQLVTRRDAAISLGPREAHGASSYITLLASPAASSADSGSIHR